MANSIPYMATRDLTIFAMGVAWSASVAQSAFLVPDFSPKEKAPSKPRKPRKPKSRVFVADLPLSNQPAACLGRAWPGTAGRAGAWQGVESEAAPVESPRLTPSQVACLEQAEAFGIATATAERTLADWRKRKHDARLRLMARKAAF